MNKKQLIDALGQLDDSVYAGTDTVNVLPGGKTAGTGSGASRRRRIFLLAAAAVLVIGGTAIAAPLLRGGTLKPEKETVDGKDYNSFKYETGEVSGVRLSEITGSVLDSMKEIPERVKNASPADSVMPEYITKRFTSLEQAVSYVGYAKLFFPRLDYAYTDIRAEVLGARAEGTEEYVPGTITLYATQQEEASGIRFETIVSIFTEANPLDSKDIRLDGFPTETAYETAEQVVNGRTFSILKQKNLSDPAGWQLSTDAFWQENGITYMFHIVYNEDTAADAERIVNQWMNAFPKSES